MGLEDSHACVLAEALSEPDCQTAILKLPRNSIGAHGAMAISKALRVNDTLHTLDLSYNVVGDVGAAALAEAVGSLSSRCALKSVSLRNNGVTAKGARAWGVAISNPKRKGDGCQLEELDLSCNSIGRPEVAAAQDI